MKTKLTSYTLDTLPPPTKEQKAHLEALASRPDSEIDYSDIPPLTEDDFKKSLRQAFHRPDKQPVKRRLTTELDADVFDWLQSHGNGYETRINAILRREMLAASKQS